MQIQHLVALDNSIHQMLMSKEVYRGLDGIPSLIDTTTLTLPSVNAVSENLVFVISGLSPKIFLRIIIRVM